MQPVSRQWISEHVPAAANAHTTIELLLETVFSTLYMQRGYKDDNRGDPHSWKSACEEKTRRLVWNGRQHDSCQLRVEFCKGGSEDRTWAHEAEESALLEAVAREQLVKPQQAGKGLVDAVVIRELWTLAVALQVLVVPSGVYKWSINPFPNPNHVYSHP
jgi:hypothetical protein